MSATFAPLSSTWGDTDGLLAALTRSASDRLDVPSAAFLGTVGADAVLCTPPTLPVVLERVWVTGGLRLLQLSTGTGGHALVRLRGGATPSDETEGELLQALCGLTPLLTPPTLPPTLLSFHSSPPVGVLAVGLGPSSAGSGSSGGGAAKHRVGVLVVEECGLCVLWVKEHGDHDGWVLAQRFDPLSLLPTAVF